MTTTAIKERPILFNGEMVRAILNGTKTQTRRVVKPQPPSEANECCHILTDTSLWVFCETDGDESWRVSDEFPCPYGQPGDRLWVQETWRYDDNPDHCQSCPLEDERRVLYQDNSNWNEVEKLVPSGDSLARIRHADTMPRWASRITLEVTDVRVERVTDISRGDCIAEGCPFQNIANETDPVGWFSELWDSINSERGFGWDQNPWVWVVEFKRLSML